MTAAPGEWQDSGHSDCGWPIGDLECHGTAWGGEEKATGGRYINTGGESTSERKTEAAAGCTGDCDSTGVVSVGGGGNSGGVRDARHDSGDDRERGAWEAEQVWYTQELRGDEGGAAYAGEDFEFGKSMEEPFSE